MSRFERSDISVIVPVLNEESTLPRLMGQLESLPGSPEIVVVDGGSDDETESLVRPPAILLRAPRGRGAQLNAGARAVSGKVLFFLHADSSLPPDPLGEIVRVMETHQAGCFGIRFDSDSALMRVCAALSNYRCFCRRIVFGDQGLFIERGLFFDMGGFPDLPLMEDYAFSLALRSRGFRIGATRSRLTASARRYGATTSSRLRTMALMLELRRMYRRGVSIDEIARRYVDAR